MAITYTPPERRRQTSLTGVARDTFQRNNFWHVFHCKGEGACNKFWMGKDLHKNPQGVYVCLDCTKPVTDITDTDLGRDFLKIVAPGFLIEQTT